MSENFNFLFHYLEKESIPFDKSEFEFQIKSHPDYPSLLSISETLSFFNIDNGAIPLDVSDIELLPNRFVALLREDNNNPVLYFIEKSNNIYICIKNEKAIEISKNEIESRWNNIVLLVEKSEIENVAKSNSNKWIWVMPSLCLSFFLLALVQCQDSLLIKLFFIFPMMGLLFSVAALKDLFGNKSGLLNKFCNITKATSCGSVISSRKWRVFELVNFSDLSMFFFGSQFIGFIFFMFENNTVTFFTIQEILLFGAIPVIFLSLYYQRFVEKKWCPICLVIITIVLLEQVYLITFQNTAFAFSTKGLIILGFVFLSVIIIWSALKKLFAQQKELKEDQRKAIRFERNYTIFRNSLFAKEKTQLPQSTLLLGNKESKTIITIISNPFCGHCKDAHEIIDAILAKHQNEMQFQVILKINLETESEEGKKLCRSLMVIYKQCGEAAFMKALKSWFDNKNLTEWFDLFPANSTNDFDAIFNNQRKWCEENDYNYTPSIFVNGYEYPRIYDRSNLPFYINELVEDNF
jgi:uncharacterized membrane protein